MIDARKEHDSFGSCARFGLCLPDFKEMTQEQLDKFLGWLVHIIYYIIIKYG